MSVCTFLASDVPLEGWRPSQDDPFSVNLDGGEDDCFFSYPFSEVRTYTSKPFGVVLSWNGSERSARKIMEYIKMAIQKADSIELWHVWLTDYYEFEDRPFLHQKVLAFSQLSPAHLQALEDAEIWNTPDKQYPNRPSFYCLTITRE